MNLVEKLTIEEKRLAERYKNLVFSINFDKLLARSIADDVCILCGDGEVLKNGLCLNCSVRIQSPLTQFVLNEYEITIEVKRRKS